MTVFFSLGVFYMTSYLLRLLCVPGYSFFLSSCLLCSTVEEDLWHLFLEYLFVRGLGDAISSTFGYRLYLDGSVLNL